MLIDVKIAQEKNKCWISFKTAELWTFLLTSLAARIIPVFDLHCCQAQRSYKG